MAVRQRREDLTENKDDNNSLFALGLSDDFGGFFSISSVEEDNTIPRLEEIDNMDIEDETKYKLINEYNNYKNSKSVLEREKYKKRIEKLLK